MIDTRRQYVLLTGFILLFLSFIVYRFIDNTGILSSSETIQLSAKQLQRAINQNFPLEYKNTQINLKVKNPKIQLKAGWQYIEIKMDLYAAFKTRRANRKLFRPIYKGKITLSGILNYSPKSGNIVLSETKLRVFNPASIKNTEIVTIEKFLLPFLQHNFNRYPVYRLKGKQFKHDINKMVLHEVVIAKDKVAIELALKL